MSRKALPPDPPSVSMRNSVPAANGTPGSRPAPGRRASRKLDDPVSLGLRKLWEDVEREPVPDAMMALLDAIDAARTAQTGTERPDPPAEPGESP